MRQDITMENPSFSRAMMEEGKAVVKKTAENCSRDIWAFPKHPVLFYLAIVGNLVSLVLPSLLWPKEG